MQYKKIDMETYQRREHFNHFLTMKQPMISITIKLDITNWLNELKEAQYPFFLCFQYAVVHAANKVPAFRQRILNNEIIEYNFCNPSYSYALDDGTFRFCSVNANQNLTNYIDEARKKQNSLLQTEFKELDDTLSLFFISCAPWFSYESLSLAYPDNHFSIPNFTWGKYTKENKVLLENNQIVLNEVYTIPLTIMFNHALIDGIHIKEFLNNLEIELMAMIETYFKDKSKQIKKI